MVELLKEHKQILTEMLATIPTDAQPSARALLSIYVEILTDGISILNSLIDYLDKP